jgi:hypothetical protein
MPDEKILYFSLLLWRRVGDEAKKKPLFLRKGSHLEY